MTDRRAFLLGATAGGFMTAAAIGAGKTDIHQSRKTPSGLRAHLSNEMRKAQIPGMQVAVLRQGRVIFLESLGLADVENSVPVTNATVFQIASCTKAFVGVAAMQLVESGKLDLASPISRYLENLPATWGAVTVGQTAAHMSGLPNIVNDFTVRLIVDGDAEASWAKVRTMPLEFTPGERFGYNQTNYAVLGKIIDVLSGETFVQFIRNRQLDAVGMPRTVYGDDRDVVSRSARTYTLYTPIDGKPQRTKTLYKVYIEFPSMLRACGGLNSTAEDMAHWLGALQRGKLLKNPSNLTTLRTAQVLSNGKPGPWGIGGWVIERSKHRAFFAVGAAKSAFAVYPDDDLAVVVLTNLSADLGLPFIDSIAAHYIPDFADVIE